MCTHHSVEQNHLHGRLIDFESAVAFFPATSVFFPVTCLGAAEVPQNGPYCLNHGGDAHSHGDHRHGPHGSGKGIPNPAFASRVD